MKALIRQRLVRWVYRLVGYPEAQEQIAALPDEALNGGPIQAMKRLGENGAN